jgi:molecular chaperone GrpE
MVDEAKQTENAANQESQQQTTNEVTAKTMNSNPEEVATNVPSVDANTPSSQNSVEVESVPSSTAPEANDRAALAEKEREIESLKASLEERTSQYVRMGADFENFRKRTLKEKEDLEQKIKQNTLQEILPVVDNFERARAQLKPQTDAEMNLHKSYQGVYKQLVDCLKRLGVSAMRPEGKEFDPNLHEAVMREPTSEYPEGTVIEELVRGYYLGDRVLRHALVKVATTPEETSPETVAVETPPEVTDN